MGESQGAGTGAAGFGGAAAGLAAGAAAAGFGGVAGTAGAAGFVSDETGPAPGKPEEVAFTSPGPAGCSAAGFGSPSGGDAGDLMSSGIFAQAQSYGSALH